MTSGQKSVGCRAHSCRANTQRRRNRSSQKTWSHPSQRAEAAAALRHAVRKFLCCRTALISWSMALKQSRCVTREQQSADCFMSIRGMINSVTSYKIIESRACTLSGNGHVPRSSSGLLHSVTAHVK